MYVIVFIVIIIVIIINIIIIKKVHYKCSFSEVLNADNLSGKNKARFV